MTFEEARSQFPVLERFAYLNAGTNGPLARSTVDTMEAMLRQDVEQGRGGRPYFEQLVRLRDEARAALAALLGVPADNVALVSSTTNGCNIVLAGLDLGPDDEVVTTDVEHFGLLGPLFASPARVRVAAVRDAPAERAPELVLAAVTSKTRLIAISHVSWMTGNSLFPSRLRTETDVPILVDGAQSVGAIDVDAGEFDFYTVSAQKWPCGPDATGALYVHEPEALRIAQPTYMSQVEYDVAGASFTPRAGAARFDSVWIPLSALAGLLVALEAAPDWQFERVAQMARRCRERLVEAGYVDAIATEPEQAGLVTFAPRDEPAEVAARLYDAGVVVRDLPGTPWLRVSCGWWTSEEDLERLVEGLGVSSGQAGTK
jgi:L-cysteine/cystine lyase